MGFDSGKANRLVAGLPAPPRSSDYSRGKSLSNVIIKGFLGNKVIAEIGGITLSLGVNQTARGVKVLGIDHKNLTCDFKINGKKVTKTMKPIVKRDDNVEIRYTNN